MANFPILGLEFVLGVGVVLFLLFRKTPPVNRPQDALEKIELGSIAIWMVGSRCLCTIVPISGNSSTSEWTNHRNAKSSKFANFVGEPGFNLNSPTFSRKPRIQEKNGFTKPFCPTVLCCDGGSSPERSRRKKEGVSRLSLHHSVDCILETR